MYEAFTQYIKERIKENQDNGVKYDILDQDIKHVVSEIMADEPLWEQIVRRIDSKLEFYIDEEDDNEDEYRVIPLF